MFEHEQHDAWLLGRANRRYDAGNLAERTRRIDPPQVTDQPNGRLGYASAKRTQRAMIFPQTKPTSANEANLENLMKTMFEHEQDDACLLRRTNLRYCTGTLAKRTEKQTKTSFFAKRTQAADHSAFQPNEPTRAAPSWLRSEAHSHRSGTRSTSANSARTNPLRVMRGLDPRIHLLAKKMDCRVKPGNDDRDSK
jgi:hypothetical protein